MMSEIVIIGLLVFLIISVFIGGGTTTGNQGFILEKIDKLEKEIRKLNQNKEDERI